MTSQNKMQTLKYLAPLGYALLPLFAGAQSIDSILRNVGTTLNTIIGILFIIATVVFLWGVIQFISQSGNPEAQKKAKGIMLWGIVGLAVMAAAWGVTQILIQYFQVPSQGPGFTAPPRVP